MAALSIAAKKWKQPKYPPTDEWINKMCCMEYYSAIKGNEVHTTTWINFENTLSEIRKGKSLSRVRLFAIP